MIYAKDFSLLTNVFFFQTLHPSEKAEGPKIFQQESDDDHQVRQELCNVPGLQDMMLKHSFSLTAVSYS